ncbi:MAG: deoxynucleotide monophosphate kinase [endosymbiont of Seepiophila jonesi]|uniref:Deoxynucleotide monophosphate kinase n=1 Tax=endosymbiont of Lamellibrachia luymesi TaxID=2200907 RepID=A0A370DZ14_9GAMM|nr:MAG: deoxynucleotide monophosphate kinase [endosymbiont of Lamellibrachia luymesi]RDH93174.1 MAG: deoxynucleotide monophosphate kinase [endosymbiont of Seepiophila jonesi]
MSEMIIGLAGKARVGKDTAARFIEEWYGLEPLSFAAPLKQSIQEMFNLTPAQMNGAEKEEPIPELGCSPRFLFQTLGTQWGRHLVHPDVWLHVAGVNLQRYRDTYREQGERWHGCVFSDVRFDNEANWIRQQGGVVIHLDRRQAPTVRERESEFGVGRVDGDPVVSNHSTVDELYKRLRNTVDVYLEGRNEKAAC